MFTVKRSILQAVVIQHHPMVVKCCFYTSKTPRRHSFAEVRCVLEFVVTVSESCKRSILRVVVVVVIVVVVFVVVVVWR